MPCFGTFISCMPTTEIPKLPVSADISAALLESVRLGFKIEGPKADKFIEDLRDFFDHDGCDPKDALKLFLEQEAPQIERVIAAFAEEFPAYYIDTLRYLGAVLHMRNDAADSRPALSMSNFYHPEGIRGSKKDRESNEDYLLFDSKVVPQVLSMLFKIQNPKEHNIAAFESAHLVDICAPAAPLKVELKIQGYPITLYVNQLPEEVVTYREILVKHGLMGAVPDSLNAKRQTVAPLGPLVRNQATNNGGMVDTLPPYAPAGYQPQVEERNAYGGYNTNSLPGPDRFNLPSRSFDTMNISDTIPGWASDPEKLLETIDSFANKFTGMPCEGVVFKQLCDAYGKVRGSRAVPSDRALKVSATLVNSIFAGQSKYTREYNTFKGQTFSSTFNPIFNELKARLTPAVWNSILMENFKSYGSARSARSNNYARATDVIVSSASSRISHEIGTHLPAANVVNDARMSQRVDANFLASVLCMIHRVADKVDLKQGFAVYIYQARDTIPGFQIAEGAPFIVKAPSASASRRKGYMN